MEKTKQELIDLFFTAYAKRDMEGIKQVMSENVTWTFSGHNKVAGTKKGIDEVIAFFDLMGGIMSESKPSVDKLIIAENDTYLIECQHIKTHREDGINIEHDVSVLWTFENGKIISGRHFFADPESVDAYFNAVPIHTDNQPIIVEQTYNASVAEVWKAITDENEMKKWYFKTMETFKPEVGFETEFDVEANGKHYLHQWRVTEVEHGKKITYNWKFGGYKGEWAVTFELTDENGLTKLTLTNYGIESFPQDNPDFSRESATEGWNYFIRERLKDFLEKSV
ncbi:MAG TPA: SRPBCC domain-containing protein, partial [Paludibacter sp.]|nr:SRPBCC domain-containing protein [Paludibacter sp.]